jgi:copper homeostasis protein
VNASLLIEACVDSPQSALAAEQGGAGRVELCADLFAGGCTPSAGSILLARRLLSIPVNVIIRPRGGDFCYSEAEYEQMRLDIEFCKRAGVAGVVIGILTPEGVVDVARTASLIELARPLSVTFHRAFDVTRDPWEALETLISLGVDRILTSGQEPTVLEGLDLICELVKAAGDRVIIMPGGGITARNIRKIAQATNAREMHAYAAEPERSPMRYINPRVYMGGELRLPEYAQNMTSPGHFRELRRQLEEA